MLFLTLLYLEVRMFRIIEELKGVSFTGPGRGRGIYSTPRRYVNLDSALKRMRKMGMTADLRDDENRTVAVAKKGVILGVIQ